jgi:hypothetical protein
MAGRFVSLLQSIALFSSSIGEQQAEHPVLDQLATDYYANKYRVASDEARAATAHPGTRLRHRRSYCNPPLKGGRQVIANAVRGGQRSR